MRPRRPHDLANIRSSNPTDPHVTHSSLPPQRRPRPALAVLALALLLPGAGLRALPNDRDQPIYIQSDRAERDERKGFTVYTGDVEVDQGSLHISADRVEIATNADDVSTIVATGNPAKMHQKPEPDSEPVYLNARRIEYDAGNEVLTLLQKATVTQEGGGQVTGEKIVYYIREQRVKATAGDSAAGKGRVRTVLPPRRVTANGGAAAPAPAATAPEAKPDGAP